MSSEPVGIAVVGPGRMGSLYARIASEMATTRLIAICGRSEASTQALSRHHQVPAYPAGDYRGCLDAHPDIEAVIVATSEWAHTEPVMAAIEAGKHVLVEKPMAVSVVDAEHMVQAAATVDRHLMVCHSLRFDPRFAALHRAVVDEGQVGQVMHLYGRRNPPRVAVERVLGRFPLAFWLAPHDIDMMLWTVGSPVIAVRAYARAGGRERQDFIIAVLTFADGAIGVLESSWATPLLEGRPRNELFSVRGSAGVVEVMGHENGVAVYRPDVGPSHPDTGYTPVVHDQQEGMFRSLLRHFAGVVRGRWSPQISGQDGLAAIRVAAAIDRSLAEGRTVELP